MEKIILSLIPKITKSLGTIPICEYVFVQAGIAYVFNFETELVFRSEIPDGLYRFLNGEFFPADQNPDDFPIFPKTKLPDQHQQFCISNPKQLANLSVCKADDPMRPVMNGVMFSPKAIVASDAHVLKIMRPDPDSVTGEEFEFISPMPPVLVAALSGSNFPVCVYKLLNDEADPDNSFGYIRYSFNSFQITVRETEGKYPKYEGVIPKVDSCVSFIEIPTTQLAKMAKFGRSIKHNSQLIRVTSLVPAISEMEVYNVSKSFATFTETSKPCGEPEGVIMPMMLTEPGENEFGISYNKLEQIAKGHQGTIVLGYSGDPSRALLFWLRHDGVKHRRNTSYTPDPAPVVVKTSNQKQQTSNQKPKTRIKHPASSYPKRVIWSSAA